MVVDREASEEVEITSTGISPRAYLPIYIKDMGEYTKHSSVRLFAADTIICLTLTAENDSKNLQEELQALKMWEAD